MSSAVPSSGTGGKRDDKCELISSEKENRIRLGHNQRAPNRKAAKKQTAERIRFVIGYSAERLTLQWHAIHKFIEIRLQRAQTGLDEVGDPGAPRCNKEK